MNKCFITKLPSSIDNDNLPVLGQLRINWLKTTNLTNNSQRAISLSTNDSITVKVTGAHFTDSTLTNNLGNVKTITATDGLVSLYISNDADAVLTIDNKYSLTELDIDSQSGYFDIEDIKYCTNLTTLVLTGPQCSGDISVLSNNTNLNHITLRSKQVHGDISALGNKTNIFWIDLGNTQVSGDINVLSNLTALVDLNLENTQVSGDIKAISNLINLQYLFLIKTQVSGDISAVSKLTNLRVMKLSYTNISGNIDSLANLTKIITFDKISGLSLTGDISKIPTNADYVGLYDRKIDTNFTWTAKGRQNATFLSLEGYIPFDTTSMDNMLIDQATCTIKKRNLIAVKGTRTSASDAAITSIQNMGGTIVGVIKES